MKIQSIEPTPSPNTMKVLLSEELPAGKSNNYKKEHANEAPAVIKEILHIDGIKGVYHVADFLAVERNAKFDWKEILPKVREAFGEDIDSAALGEGRIEEGYGEVKVSIQLFNDIPMQVKLTDGMKEERFGLPDRFKEAVMKAQETNANVVLERKWKEQGVRYGEFADIGKEVVDEINAAYSEDRLNRLLKAVVSKDTEQIQQAKKSYPVTLDMLDDPEWTVRFAHLEQMEPTKDDLAFLDKALNDEKASIRRLATVYLGIIEDPVILPYLYKALKDKSVTVRRTAGDCLSDLGDEAAAPAMMEALQDKNKLVRWRAAMFLYEAGDETALPALKQAENDPEFEVDLQIKMAIERIEGGEEAKGSVWKQMTESRKG
ncbi:conserved virulence factor C family protein [Metabacillus fastidiosus]|uniref:Conserved virulence factor C family protein n=1 Tax=Metabacillus fastidiosus TaxID=1458 RepID=A0ABU6NU18_9BACI|nr:conserved virulence factor C family protein [Metabacillus fastidiosus]MED4400626.1 conserved virulence factor C family protein [Metabacillus fastidiosus]MED4462797.1 conserved virulence factor C family protein [Metabacillus fastidiosus]